MSKRSAFLITVILIVLGIVGALLYIAREKSQTPEESTANLQVKKVLDEAVISPVGAFDNNSIWYFNSEGRLFKANVDGSNLSEFTIPAASKDRLSAVLWPKTGSDFISIFGRGQKSYYDSTAKLFINLASNVQWIEWLPDGQRVVYIWQSTDKKNQQLVLAGADGTGFKNIADVFWPDLVLKASPDGKTILMYRSNIQGDVNKIYAANIDTGVVSTMVDTGKNTGVTWLPSGNKFLFAQDSKIFLYDVLNRQAADLNLETTLDKIVSDSSAKYLYAAVGSTFMKVNLINGNSEKYFEAGAEIRPKNLMLLGNTVYFINSTDNKLYRISQ